MKTYFSILMFLGIVTMYAQDFQGVAVYQSKTTFDFSFDDSRFSKERQKQMKDRMKQFGEKTFFLTFTKTQSIFKEEEKIEQPGQGRMRMFGGFNSGILFKDTKNKTYSNQVESFSKNFLVKDSLPEYEWKFEEETKLVGENLCFKATTVKEVSNRRMGPPRRDTKENDSIPKTKIITVTAWYSPDIPINNGPNNYWGLPGLILELNEGNTQYICTKITLNPQEKLVIKEPKKGKIVTQKEYVEITKKKEEEMREMYGGGNRKKGEGGRHMIIRGN